MEKIASFTIDHTRLMRGVFVSRRDTTPSGDVITTFDIRLTEPNRQTPVGGAALHTIEHLAATYLRNQPLWKDRVIYWGPMGCRTGCYLLLAGNLNPDDVLPLLRDTFSFIASFQGPIPGASPHDCGNYTYNDLPAARDVARRFITDILDHPAHCNLNYPGC